MSKSNKLVSNQPKSQNDAARADLTQSNIALINKILGDPSQFPDEFKAWIPRWLMQNVNFRLIAANLPLLEALKVVGATGQPAFANTWVAFGTSDDIPGFYKDAWGIVHITGTVKLGTVGSTIFTLPAGYRPQRNNIFPAVCNGAFGATKIDTAGVVSQLAGGSNVYHTLSGISFRAYS
jgi:hypothetical protein